MVACKRGLGSGPLSLWIAVYADDKEDFADSYLRIGLTTFKSAYSMFNFSHYLFPFYR